MKTQAQKQASKMREALLTHQTHREEGQGSTPPMITLVLPQGTVNLIDYLLQRIAEGELHP